MNDIDTPTLPTTAAPATAPVALAGQPAPAPVPAGPATNPATVNPAAATATPTPAGPAAPPAGAAISPSRRKPLLIGLGVLVVLTGAAYGLYWALVLNHFESTDNAYVQGPVVQITPQVGGTVLAILADDTDIVKAGEPLVKLDPADARLALDRAEAQLGATVREVRSLYSNNDVIGAQIRLRQADVARAQAEVARATDDVSRRRPLVASGAVGSEEMQHAEAALTVARTALVGAQSAVAAVRQQEAGSRTMTEGTSVEKHPNVLRAAGAVREAYLALQRTEVPSPVSGQVAKRTVEVGQRVAAGAPLMSVIPLEQVWIEANFKEVQLRRMRIGQPVTLHADLYGGKIDFHGHVVGLGAGTGAAFALLPAQNATGNWIKVVQRVPVRIEVDARELNAHPLRVGLSMEAEVDIADQSGRPIGDGAPTTHANARTNATAVFDAQQARADEVVQQVIDDNMGKPSGSKAAPTVSGKPVAGLARTPARRRDAGLTLDTVGT